MNSLDVEKNKRLGGLFREIEENVDFWKKKEDKIRWIKSLVIRAILHGEIIGSKETLDKFLNNH
jgi:hypothetical protein